MKVRQVKGVFLPMCVYAGYLLKFVGTSWYCSSNAHTPCTQVLAVYPVESSVVEMN